jgi:EAL domain-containing protein (putative c-di-GMP-specific phosphodiesterase class I)
MMPGPVVQVQAGETLLIGGGLARPVAWPVSIAIALSLMLIGRIDGWKPRAAALVIVTGGVVFSCEALEAAGVVALRQVPALLEIILTGGAWATLDFLRTINRTERQEGSTGLPNGLALNERLRGVPQYHIVAVRFPRLTEALAILGDGERTRLLLTIADRLRLGTGVPDIHLVGGETFCWSLPIPAASGAADGFASIASLFLPPLSITGRQISLAPRIGVAGGLAEEVADVLARATNAARRAERDDTLWILDDGKVVEAAVRNQRLLADLSTALADRHIWVAYQAKSDIASGRIIGAEALIRWAHPGLGAISPADFIPLFEGEQLMHAPTLYVLDAVLDDLRAWSAAGLEINVAVNISSTLLQQWPFIEAVALRLSINANLASQLTFEITESAAINVDDAAIAVLNSWRATGARVSIDDYGTGLSTLSYLKAFPANEIKIDQSFVRDLEKSANDRVLVRSTIDLAHELGMKVVAEGVEDAACLAVLRSMGCDVAQGWHIGKPVPCSAFADALRTRDIAA